MPIHRKKRSWNDWPVWFGLALVLLVAYGGAYATMVEHSYDGSTAIITPLPNGGQHLKFARRIPSYSDKDDLNFALRLVFWPVHLIDRNLQRDVWDLSREPEQ